MTMIYGKINGPWNIDHCSTYSLQGGSLSDIDPLSQVQHFFDQIVFKIWSKITGPWNIGHWPTHT